MSIRKIKISRSSSRRGDFADIEDLIDDDKNLEIIPEDEVVNSPIRKKKISPLRVTTKSRGKRTVEIKELDPDMIPPTIKDFMDPSHTGSKIAVIGKPGCFRKGTRVRMFNGSEKRVEDVKIGDEVMGDDFTVRKVYDICRNYDLMYKITPLRGESVIVNSKHILSLKDSNDCIHDIRLDEFLRSPVQERYNWFNANGETYPFTITELTNDDYYGFILDGNHRFQLYDGSVVHNTGKSSIIRSLLYEKREIFPCAQVYSGTEDSNHAYGKFIPSSFIHNAYNPIAYNDFIRRQKLAKTHFTNPWAVCVWDDITEDERIFNQPIIKGTYKNGRHWKMLHILSLQYALDIKPVIRTNIDGTFLLRETSHRNRKVLFENYVSCMDDYNDFCSIFDQVTNDYTSLYVHNRVQSNNFEDCIFWYKARQDIPSDFKFGCREFWMFHEERYNQNYIDPV